MKAAVQAETRYARPGSDRITYQVLGEGPPDLVMTTGSFGHVDMAWTETSARAQTPLHLPPPDRAGGVGVAIA
jgi:hypothetical protein